MKQHDYDPKLDAGKNDPYAQEFGVSGEFPSYSPRPFTNEHLEEMLKGNADLADYAEMLDIDVNAPKRVYDTAHTRWIRNVNYEMQRTYAEMPTGEERRKHYDRLHLEFQVIEMCWNKLEHNYYEQAKRHEQAELSKPFWSRWIDAILDRLSG